jgi:hypothetical protein
MGFKNIHAYGAAMLGGRSLVGHLRKVPALASVAYWWSDLGMAAGSPRPNYYASSPLTSKRLDGWDGIFHGDNKSPLEMYLTEMMLVTPTANMVGIYRLLDYCLYYPFIDLDETADQEMTPDETLDRYETEGTQVMMVAQAPTTGAGSFYFSYVNQNGEAKISPVQNYTAAAAGMGAILTSQPAASDTGPFLRLANGDTGVRSIAGVTNVVANGGLGALVLVKPLADIIIREINTPTELIFVASRQAPPRIHDGAFLGFICNTIGSVAAGLLGGRLNFAWTE